MGIFSILGDLANAAIEKANDPEFRKRLEEYENKEKDLKQKKAEKDRISGYEFVKRIDENFAWVETPSAKNGEIVGKVINISEKSYSGVSVEFNLYDKPINDTSKSKVGTLRASIGTLQTEEVWNFRIPNHYQNAVSFNFQKIDAW